MMKNILVLLLLLLPAVSLSAELRGVLPVLGGAVRDFSSSGNKIAILAQEQFYGPAPAFEAKQIERSVLLVDLHNPQSPAFMGRAIIPIDQGSPNCVLLTGEYLYVGTLFPHRLLTYRVNALSTMLHSLELPGFPYDMALGQGYLYVAAGNAGIVPVALWRPNAPELGTPKPVSWNQAQNISIGRDYAFVSGANHMEVFDLADPMDPLMVLTFAEFGIEKTWASGNRLFMMIRVAGLQENRIYEIEAEPPYLKLAGKIPRKSAKVISMTPDDTISYVFVSENNGVMVYDISDLSAAKFIDAFYVGGGPSMGVVSNPPWAYAFTALQDFAPLMYAICASYDGKRCEPTPRNLVKKSASKSTKSTRNK